MVGASGGLAWPVKILNFSSVTRNLCETWNGDFPAAVRGSRRGANCPVVRPRRANSVRDGTSPWRESHRQTSGLSGTPGQLGAPALGYGRHQTPPNHYPPARLPQLLAEAFPA